MSRDWRRSVERFLNRDLFSGRVIPRDGAVDSNLFSEDEFPVYCPKCGYLLRGLPDGRCPECGTSFERGRLLVRQYVFKYGEPAWRSTRMGKWMTRLLIAGYLLVVLAYAGLYVALRWMKTQDTPAKLSAALETLGTALKWAQVVMILALVLGLVLSLAAGILFVVRIWRNASKRRRILDALQNGGD